MGAQGSRSATLAAGPESDARPLGRNSRRVVLVTMRMGNHAGPSGYDHLCRAIPGEVLSVHRRRGLAGRALARALVPLVRRSGSQWYDRTSALAELAVAWRWLTRKDVIYHFLYGENCVRYLPALTRRSRRNRLVATFHTPGWRMQEVVRQPRALRHLDLVVVMSTSQVEYWADMVGTERVAFVPHGIDTQYFTPQAPGESNRTDRPCVLTVGHHLRDFDLLADVAARVGQRSPEIEFVVVSRPDRLGPLTGLPNVTARSGLSDAGLRELYQRADVLFLPLQDATANNALLEGMACGLPLLATDIQGVRDYAAVEGSVLRPNDPEAFAQEIEGLCGGAYDLDHMRRASRSRAEALSWPRVGRAMIDAYERLP